MSIKNVQGLQTLTWLDGDVELLQQHPAGNLTVQVT
jgi:hypothetical protein